MRPELERFNPEGVSFVDGTSEPFAAVIAATGFRPDFGGLTAALAATLIDGYPARSGQESGLPGVFFCGFRVAPTGMLRELGIEARRISEAIAAAGTPAGAASSVAAAALRG
jgi:hypothetical protein